MCCILDQSELARNNGDYRGGRNYSYPLDYDEEDPPLKDGDLRVSIDSDESPSIDIYCYTNYRDCTRIYTLNLFIRGYNTAYDNTPIECRIGDVPLDKIPDLLSKLVATLQKWGEQEEPFKDFQPTQVEIEENAGLVITVW